MRKRVILFLVSLLMLTFILNKTFVFASGITGFTAKTEVNGDIKKGSKIKITINVNDVNIYAADIWLKYDKSLIKVTKMEKGSIISDTSVQTFQVENKFDNNSGKARLEFSCLGKIDGFKGSGDLLVLYAEVLKDGILSINSKPFLKEPDDNYNLKLQIVDKNLKELSFNYTKTENKTTDGNEITSDNNIKDENGSQVTDTVNAEESKNNNKFNKVNTSNNKYSRNTSFSAVKQEDKTAGGLNKSIYYIAGLILIIILTGFIYYRLVLHKKDSENT